MSSNTSFTSSSSSEETESLNVSVSPPVGGLLPPTPHVLPVEVEEVVGSSGEVEEVEGGDTDRFSMGRTPWLSSSSRVADWTSPPVRLRAASDASLSKPKYSSCRDTDRGQTDVRSGTRCSRVELRFTEVKDE